MTFCGGQCAGPRNVWICGNFCVGVILGIQPGDQRKRIGKDGHRLGVPKR